MYPQKGRRGEHREKEVHKYMKNARLLEANLGKLFKKESENYQTTKIMKEIH